MAATGFRFLYRQGEGVLDAPGWARAVWKPLALIAAILALWRFLGPAAPHPMGESDLQDPHPLTFALGALGYLLAATLSLFGVVLLAVAAYFVSAKRFRGLGLPAAMAGLAPLSLLFAWAGHWYAAHVADSAPVFVAYGLDLLALAACGWSVFALGFGASPGGKS